MMKQQQIYRQIYMQCHAVQWKINSRHGEVYFSTLIK